ncbi:MAG: threonine synthase [Lachnospiraceae bacterium]|nr:threonine synthase [Lachnospiraceae bacterium]
MKLFRGMRGSILVFSIIYVLIGLILLVVSDAPLLAISYIFSVLLIVTGVVLIMYYIGRDVTAENESYDLVAGVVAATAGIYLMINAKVLYPWLPAVMGFMVLISGLITFQNALDMRRMKQVFWAPVFLVALGSLALGFVILFYPFEKTTNMLRVIGASLLLSGGIDVITAIWQAVRMHGAKAVTEDVKAAVVNLKDEVVETAIEVKKEVATAKENKYNKALEKTKGNGEKMEVIYSSTRNAAETATASQAILKGLAENGGLFVPNTIPALDISLETLANMSYQEVAYEVMCRMFTDFTEEELKYCINSAYDSKFDTPEIAPLKKAHGANYLELFHGSTIAFKDMALSILPYLLTTSAKKNQVKNDIVILTATSGDTGKAALAGFADVPGTKIIVFYPKHGVSPIQEKQMVTQRGANTSVVGIIGNFDDAQTGVKNMFNDKELAKEMDAANMQFSSANSINIGRLVPQMVYYVYAYSRLIADGTIKAGDKINVVVPTGNFGNILAAYYAKEMGLPIAKFICASNENKVLYDFFRTGEYDKNREFILTSSPSMDILISSNLERLIYKIAGNNAEKNAELMKALNTEGKYVITPEMKEKLSEFFGGYASEEETAETIKKVYEEDKYIMDTHTAVAATVYDKYVAETGDTTPTVIASTASPYKFTRSVMNAIDHTYDSKTDFELIDELNKISGVAIPQAIEDIRSAPVLHDTVCDKSEMEATVKSILKL